MRRFTGTLFDAAGVTMPSVSIKIVQKNTTNLVTVYNGTGQSISNPLTTDNGGQFAFYVPSGSYDFLDSGNNKLQSDVQIFDFGTPSEWISAASIPVIGLTGLPNISAALSYLYGLLNPPALPSIVAIPGSVIVQGINTLLPYSVRFRVPYTLAVAMGGVANGSTPLFLMPARSVILGILFETVTPFAHPTATGVQCGMKPVGGADNDFGFRDVKIAGQSSSVTASYRNPSPTLAAMNMSVDFVIVGSGVLNGLTAGNVDITVTLQQLP